MPDSSTIFSKSYCGSLKILPRPDKKCCALAESYGVLLYCNTFSAQEIRIITASPEFAARLPRLFKRAFGLGFDVLPKEGTAGKSSFKITDRG